MRGKAKLFPCGIVFSRITPAHAGKRMAIDGQCIRYEDHPRTCGEKDQMCNHFTCFRRSPPHMRGKEWQGSEFLADERITPAHAGKRKSQ